MSQKPALLVILYTCPQFIPNFVLSIALQGTAYSWSLEIDPVPVWQVTLFRGDGSFYSAQLNYRLLFPYPRDGIYVCWHSNRLFYAAQIWVFKITLPVIAGNTSCKCNTQKPIMKQYHLNHLRGAQIVNTTEMSTEWGMPESCCGTQWSKDASLKWQWLGFVHSDPGESGHRCVRGRL